MLLQHTYSAINPTILKPDILTNDKIIIMRHKAHISHFSWHGGGGGGGGGALGDLVQS